MNVWGLRVVACGARDVALDTHFTAPYLCVIVQIAPDWRKEVKARHDEDSAISAARALVAWCRDHHQNKVVQKRFNSNVCDDEPGHGKQYALLRSFKRGAAGETNQHFPTAFKVLDDAFGQDAWRPKLKAAQGTTTSSMYFFANTDLHDQ